MAGTITVSGVPDLQFTPGSYVRVIFGGSGARGPRPLNIFLAGNMIAAAITGAAPSFSVAAGSEPDGRLRHRVLAAVERRRRSREVRRGLRLHAMARACSASGGRGGLQRRRPGGDLRRGAGLRRDPPRVRHGLEPDREQDDPVLDRREKVRAHVHDRRHRGVPLRAIAAAILAKRSLP